MDNATLYTVLYVLVGVLVFGVTSIIVRAEILLYNPRKFNAMPDYQRDAGVAGFALIVATFWPVAFPLYLAVAFYQRLTTDIDNHKERP